MEVNLIKDLPVNFSPPATNAASKGSAAQAETPALKTELDKNGFSDKLTAAMEETAPNEIKPSEGKKVSLSAETAKSGDENAADDDADNQETAATLAMGLIWLQTPIVTPVAQPEESETQTAGAGTSVQVEGLAMNGQQQADKVGLTVAPPQYADTAVQQSTSALPLIDQAAAKLDMQVPNSQPQAIAVSNQADSVPTQNGGVGQGMEAVAATQETVGITANAAGTSATPSATGVDVKTTAGPAPIAANTGETAANAARTSATPSATGVDVKTAAGPAPIAVNTGETAANAAGTSATPAATRVDVKTTTGPAPIAANTGETAANAAGTNATLSAAGVDVKATAGSVPIAANTGETAANAAGTSATPAIAEVNAQTAATPINVTDTKVSEAETITAQTQGTSAATATGLDLTSQVNGAASQVPATEPKPVKEETWPLQENQGPLTQTTEAQQAAPAEKQAHQGLLSDSEKDSTSLYDDKSNAAATFSAVSFDKLTNFADHVTAAKAQAPETRADRYEIARQVMDGLQTSTDQLKTSQVIITLKPENLGEVTIKINVDGDKVTAAFHAASAEVRSILESSLPQFKQEMSQQGWNFDSEGIYSAMQEFMGKDQGQQPQQFQQQMFSTPVRQQQEIYDDGMAISSGARNQVISTSAVDYRI